MAWRVAQELQDSWVVNIGIGMPLLVPPHVRADRDVIFHSENGIIGMGPEIEGGDHVDPDLLSAGKRPVRLMPGGSFVHHADSFALARGGRLDAAILGAFQVAQNGDLANWKLPGARTGSIGGAMDIAVGARRVLILMSHTTREGEPKLVDRLAYPPTARGVVTKVFTELGVFAITEDGFVLEEIAPGVCADQVRAGSGAQVKTDGATLMVPPDPVSPREPVLSRA
ncbi:3-oxoacid CoA-transferase subunit B [Aquabacter spiritensis]|nr:3-oxoacid CoA-transferase subunit B [Aquabacter spiritensis]